MQNHVEHEAIAREVSAKYLADFNYSSTEIEQVCELILATKIPQSPSQNLWRFYVMRIYIIAEFEWLASQCDFLAAHKLFTETAWAEQDEQKGRNRSEIKREVEKKILAKT